MISYKITSSGFSSFIFGTIFSSMKSMGSFFLEEFPLES